MPVRQINALCFSTWSELHAGKAMPLAEVAERFRAYSLETAIGLLTRIEFLLWNAERPDISVQDYIGEGLLGAPDWRSLVDAARKVDSEDVPIIQVRPFMWHAQLVLNAVKLSLLQCPIETKTEPKSLKDLAIGILALSDYVGAALPEPGTPAEDEALRHHVTINGVFNAAEHQLQLLPLGRRLYLSDHAHLRSHALYANLRQLLEGAIGLPPDLLLSLGVAVSAYWQTRHATKFHEGVAPLNLKAYLGSTQVTASQIDAFLRVTSRDAAHMQASVKERYSLTDLRPFSFVPMAETPIVVFGDSQYCSSFKLLTRRLSTDLHYFFLRYLSETDKKRYLGFHGIAFEDTAHSTLRQCLKRVRKEASTAPLARYYELDDFDKEHDEGRADAVIVSRDLLVILDAKAGRYPAPVFDGDFAALELFTERILVKAARQIDTTLRRLTEGSLTLPGLNPRRALHIVPMVVTLQYFGWNPLLAAHVARRLAAEGLLRDPRFTELQLAELESLLVLADNPQRAGFTFPALLLQRARDAWCSADSLQNFLVSLGDRVSWRLPTLRREVDDVYKLAVGVMHPRRGDALNGRGHR